MNKWQTIWAAIYEQANAHYREIAKKRDQVIAFYVLLLAGLLGSWDKLKDYRDAVVAGLALVGVASYWLCVQYWRWHTMHVNTMVTVQRLMSQEAPPTLNGCSKAWCAVNDVNRSAFRLMFPTGAEAAILYVLAILTFIPIYLLARGTTVLPLRSSSDVAAIVTDVVPYSLILVFGASLYVRRFHAFHPNDWPFRWLRDIESEISKADLRTSE